MFQKIIKFSSVNPDLFEEKPKPSKKCVPDWYKDLPNYSEKINNFQSPTIKKCVPVLDSLTIGYIIPNPIETVFWEEEDTINWSFNSSFEYDFKSINVGISTHNVNQIHKSFVRETEYIQPFKWMNPWFIQTPKGYSCIFTNPLNRQDDSIRIIDGVVDTDDYPLHVNFPFFLKRLKKNECFVMKKGYPIALVFPFLRDDWKMKIDKINKKGTEEQNNKHFKLFTSIKDNYKNMYWRKKQYD